MDGDGLYDISQIFAKCTPKAAAAAAAERMAMEEHRMINRNAQSTKSLPFLPEVHERQVERLRARSEWFLSPVATARQVAFAEDSGPSSAFDLRSSSMDAAGLANKGAAGLSASAESVLERAFLREPDLLQGGEISTLKDDEKAVEKDGNKGGGREEEEEEKKKEEEGAEQGATKKKKSARPKKAKKILALAD